MFKTFSTYTVGPRFTNAPVHKQFGSRTNFPSKKMSRMTNGFSDYEHASWQQRQAGSISAGVSCWLTSAQYTSLLDFGLRTFRFTNGLQERIKFVNLGPTVFIEQINQKYKMVSLEGSGVPVLYIGCTVPKC
jgi:hypothetical protein